MEEYGCGQLMVKGEVCTSLGDVVNLCDACQRKLINTIEDKEAAQRVFERESVDIVPADHPATPDD